MYVNILKGIVVLQIDFILWKYSHFIKYLVAL